MSSISSLIDPIESAVNDRIDMNLTEKLCTVRQFVGNLHLENKMASTSKNVELNEVESCCLIEGEATTTLNDANRCELPVLTLAEKNSAEIYQENFFEPEQNNYLVMSDTLFDSDDSFNK